MFATALSLVLLAAPAGQDNDRNYTDDSSFDSGNGGDAGSTRGAGMPQTCYAPRYGCYAGQDRFMHRYPAFHGVYYRRPYNYRNLFDYPWHAQLHEPTSMFSYNVPAPEEVKAPRREVQPPQRDDTPPPPRSGQAPRRLRSVLVPVQPVNIAG